MLEKWWIFFEFFWKKSLVFKKKVWCCVGGKGWNKEMGLLNELIWMYIYLNCVGFLKNEDWGLRIGVYKSCLIKSEDYFCFLLIIYILNIYILILFIVFFCGSNLFVGSWVVLWFGGVVLCWLCRGYGFEFCWGFLNLLGVYVLLNGRMIYVFWVDMKNWLLLRNLIW